MSILPIILTSLMSVLMQIDCFSAEPEHTNITGKKRPNETILVSQTDKKPKHEQNYKLIKPVNGFYASPRKQNENTPKRKTRKTQLTTEQLDVMTKKSWLSIGSTCKNGFFNGLKWTKNYGHDGYTRNIDHQFCNISQNHHTGNWTYEFKGTPDQGEFQSLELVLAAIFKNHMDEILRSGR